MEKEPRKKPGPKPGEGAQRTALTTIRSTPEWKSWLDRYARFKRLTVADAVDLAIVAQARADGFSEVAPKR